MSDDDSDRNPETGLLPLWQVGPDLDRITYSHDATVAAIKDYYEFLTKMYMNEDDIAVPPESGWPDMENIRELNKTDEVINLLRHIPYTRPSSIESEVQAAAFCQFEDWARRAQDIATLPRPLSSDDIDSTLRVTQGIREHIPPYVVGLVNTKDFQILLDTKFGIVYFIGPDATPGLTRKAASTDELYPVIKAMPCEYAPEEEEEWRGGQGPCAWKISDFFSLLKHHFRQSNYVSLPLWGRGTWEVVENFDGEEYLQEWQTVLVLPRVRDIFGGCGWPDLERYRKDECIIAVKRVVEEHIERIEED